MHCCCRRSGDCESVQYFSGVQFKFLLEHFLLMSSDNFRIIQPVVRQQDDCRQKMRPIR